MTCFIRWAIFALLVYFFNKTLIYRTLSPSPETDIHLVSPTFLRWVEMFLPIPSLSTCYPSSSTVRASLLCAVLRAKSKSYNTNIAKCFNNLYVVNKSCFKSKILSKQCRSDRVFGDWVVEFRNGAINWTWASQKEEILHNFQQIRLKILYFYLPLVKNEWKSADWEEWLLA